MNFLNIFIITVHIIVWETLIFYVDFAKKLFSLFTPRFFIQKFILCGSFFWEGEGCNSLSKCALRVGSTFKTNRVKEVGQGEGGVKYWKFCANMLFVSLGPDPLPANHNPTIFFDLPGFKKLSCPRQTFCTFLTMTLLIISE